jgi:hypothetical protein
VASEQQEDQIGRADRLMQQCPRRSTTARSRPRSRNFARKGCCPIRCSLASNSSIARIQRPRPGTPSVRSPGERPHLREPLQFLGQHPDRGDPVRAGSARGYRIPCARTDHVRPAHGDLVMTLQQSDLSSRRPSATGPLGRYPTGLSPASPSQLARTHHTPTTADPSAPTP